MRPYDSQRRAWTLFCALLGALAVLALPAGASASGNAGYTTIKVADTCLNGPGVVNCNLYDAKTDVYMNGGPTGGSGLADGEYFFAVLAPGSQNGGFLDGADGNLSDTTPSDAGPGGGDLVANRTFHEKDGEVVLSGADQYTGSHDTGVNPNVHNVIGLFPFDDTPNNGGVYILAICKAGATSSKDCKFDAFKVNQPSECQENCPVPPADDLVVTKDANPTLKRTFPWDITKQADKTHFDLSNSPATVTYTIGVTKGAGVDSDWQVSGTISVLNPNAADVTGVDVTDDINDANNSDTCVVTGGTNQTIPGNSSADFGYVCTYSAAPDPTDQVNTAKASYSAQTLSGGSELAAAAPTFDVPFSFNDAVATLVDNCTSVKDTLDGVTTTLDSNLCTSHTFTPVVNFPVQQGCKDHNNTATETPADVGLPESASATVTVCGPTGHTMGFWQNKNGQAIITGGTSTAGVCNSGTWLRSYNPFKDLPATASCAQVGTYVLNVIKLATCGLKDKTCNPMLKAQMLATALGVFFSDPALGGNQIGSPAPLGAMVVNLAAGGWKPAFGGANSMSVANMLAFAASQSNSGGSSWYGQVKATQVLASNAFDAINNSIAPVI